MTRKDGKRGGKRLGAGRKSGSIRPERRILIAMAWAQLIDEFREEGKGRNTAVRQTRLEAYAKDHPNRAPCVAHSRRKTEHFAKYCVARGKARVKGGQDFMKLLDFIKQKYAEDHPDAVTIGNGGKIEISDVEHFRHYIEMTAQEEAEPRRRKRSV